MKFEADDFRDIKHPTYKGFFLSLPASYRVALAQHVNALLQRGENEPKKTPKKYQRLTASKVRK